jgi:excisionase family DNA binding protein
MDLVQELRQRGTYLSTAEVMSLLDTSRGTLCEWVRVGRISAVRKGNAYLFDPRRLADWLSERTTNVGRRTV